MFEQEVQQPGLVDDEVRELREAVPHVLDPSETLEPRWVGRVRPPEPGLVDPVRLGHHPLGEPERLEGLNGAAIDAVGPAHLQRPGGSLHDPGDDLGKLRQLGRQQQARRAGADDEDVHLLRQRGLIFTSALGRRPNPWVTLEVAVEEVLHAVLQFISDHPPAWQAWSLTFVRVGSTCLCRSPAHPALVK